MAMNMAQAAKLVREMGKKVKELKEKVEAMEQPDLDGFVERIEKLENKTVVDMVKMFNDHGIYFRRLP